jgi:hypothetical protein
MRRLVLLPFLLVLAGCVQSADPAEGGFFSGIAGLAGGGYEARITEREGEVADARARQAALTAELAALEAEHGDLKARIARQRAALRTRGVALPPETEARVEATLATEPRGRDPAARALALQQAIGDARRLSEQLAMLAV